MRPRNHTYWTALAITLVVPLVVVKLNLIGETQTFPVAVADRFAFADWVNALDDWLREHFRWLTRGIAGAIGASLNAAKDFLLWLPWTVVVLAVALPALKFGGLRLALFCVVATLFWGLVDMWGAAMETLSLMAVSVFFSVLLGVSLGVACSQSNILWSIFRPALDAMQTMPTFVYLIPAIFFFGVGEAPAVAATIIYALPPAVRLTNLGIRQVSAETVEAARAFGSTTVQTLMKVQLPLALPSIMLGINQTVMMALGMVVIATFIGAGGLGYEVWQALARIDVGWSLEGGLCIVFMAIIFDRLSYAMSRTSDAEGQHASGFRLLPLRLEYHGWAQAIERSLGVIYTLFSAIARGLTSAIAGIAELVARIVIGKDNADGIRTFLHRHTFLVASLCVLIAVVVVDRNVMGFGEFPESWQYSIRQPVDDALNVLKVNADFYAFTTWIRATVFNFALDPLADLLVWLPWWYFTGVVALVAWVSAGRGVALASVALLLFIGAVDLWAVSMFTLATILASALLCIMIGIPIGILAACNNFIEAIMRPVLDAMQTMPAFVYLVPVLMFFGANVVSAVIATVIYALPPIIRLTNLGIREVSTESVEAARSCGSTFMQILTKVKLPLALPSVMMGINQVVIFAVGMTVITPLIGGGGLGLEVFRSLYAADTGLGFEVGLSIVFLAIVMDRITQAWSRQRQIALGLQ